MEVSKSYRVGKAAEKAGVLRTTVLAAIKRGEIPCDKTACGLPMVALSDVKRWAKQERKTGPKPAKP